MNRRLYGFGLIVLAFSCNAFAQAGKNPAGSAKTTVEAADKKSKAPKTVMDAFRKQYPNATIKSASSEKENGATVYEIESMDGAQRRDLVYSAEGRVLSTEELMQVSDLPKAVVDAVGAKYPKAPIRKAEKLTDANGMRYELVIQVGGRNKEIQVDPAGKMK